MSWQSEFDFFILRIHVVFGWCGCVIGTHAFNVCVCTVEKAPVPPAKFGEFGVMDGACKKL